MVRVKLKPKVLVTGGAGFIGSHLTDALVNKYYDVTVIDNLSKGKIENVNKKARFIKADVRSKNLINFLNTLRPDYIFHLAAQSSLNKSIKNPKGELKINFLPVVDLLNKAKVLKVKKVIFASSAAVYGSVAKLPIAEDAPKLPISPYGIAKLTSEHFIRHFYEYHNLPYVILRYANVYGQRQDTSAEGGAVGIFIQKMLKAKPVEIFGDGRQTRDFVHFSDVVEASILAIHKDIIGEFNVGTAEQTSINDLFAIIAEISGARHSKKYKLARNKEVKHNMLSYRKFQRATGWRPKVGIKQGLKMTFEYFKSQLQ